MALKISHFNFVRYMGANTSIIRGGDVTWIEFLRDSDFLLFIKAVEKKIGEEKCWIYLSGIKRYVMFVWRTKTN